MKESITDPVQLPSDEIMRQMAKIAIEKATEDLAKIAVEMAAEFRNGKLPMINASEALESWARAIRSNNVLHYGPKDKSEIS